MSDLVIADFPTQFAACAALDKLMSRGMPRAAASICSSESVGGSSASSIAPTTVVSRVSHHAAPRNEVRAPAEDPIPSRVAHATLTVELADLVQFEDIMRVMKKAGASSVHVLVNQSFGREDPNWSPDIDYGPATEVGKAVAASR